jgi:pyruvate dehydrogenase E2 component (dihydrolipoamide acetyltransferase)
MDPVIMPQIGQDITIGKIVRWHKREAQTVTPGEVILTVESEKASFDVEADRAGVLLKILYQEGEEAEVLSPVAYIGEPGEAVPEGAPARKLGEAAKSGEATAARASSGRVSAPEREATEVPRRAGGKPYASPSARRVAAERGIPLEGIRGTGPGGRIVKQDVLRALGAANATARASQAATEQSAVSEASGAPPPSAAGPPPAAPVSAERTIATEDTVVPFTGVRKIVAERLSLSSRSIPHFYLFQDIDMGAALSFREEYNRRERVHVTVTDLVAHAAVQALRRFPKLNAHVDGERLVLKAGVHLGLAVDSEQGLVVPVVDSAERLDLGELAEELKRITAEARRGRLDPSRRGTFTVTSLGMHGVPAFLPLINPPECAILGIGAIAERVVARGGWIAVRPLMTVVLGCDHRGVDGAEAAGFLQELKRRLENAFGTGVA